MNITEAVSIVKRRVLQSEVARKENNMEILAEGIVARAYPTMLFRNGIPIKWKLKIKDYQKGGDRFEPLAVRVCVNMNKY